MFHITQKQLLGVLLYTSIYPLSQLVGLELLGIFLIFPFHGGAYLCGSVMASVTNSDAGFMFGATAGIFFQVIGIFWIRYKLCKRYKSRA